MTSFLKTKKGQTNMAKLGVDIGMGAIFVLAIGLGVASSIITNLTTAPVNGTAQISGISATVAGYVGLIIVAGFVYLVARATGIL